MVSGCGDAPQNDEIVIQKEYFQTASEHEFTTSEEAPDTILVSGRSVIFFAPGADELDQLVRDQDTRQGVRQAIGDFAYYASIVSDSLDIGDIQVRFTERTQLVFDQLENQHSIFPREGNSLLGVVLFDGFENIKVVNGMQTHLSVLSSAEHFFAMEASESTDLLDYFKPAESPKIHVYSSHSDILNQTGTRIAPAHYQKFGPALAARADRFQMSIFAYFKLQLADSVYGMVCRVPSKYDESSVRLYLWDQATDTLLDQLELAENIWNEQWIMVKDSWLSVTPEKTLRIIQRKKEARISNGKRTEADSLYHLQWSGSGFQSLPTNQLQTKNFPLKDWESYQQPAPPTEITLTDENYVWLPLQTGDLSWENIVMQMPKPFNLDKVPIENQPFVGHKVQHKMSEVGLTGNRADRYPAHGFSRWD